MSQLKDMYRSIVQDAFPANITVDFGGQKLVYSRRAGDIGGERRGLRYGENPDQPAAMYELAEGGLVIGGVAYKGTGQGLVSSLREEHMIQAGKHPGKTNLTDVDNGINMLQYLTARPAALILKHNNPSGAAWSDKGVADALSKAFWGDRIAAFGGAVVVNRPLDMNLAALLEKTDLPTEALVERMIAAMHEADYVGTHWIGTFIVDYLVSAGRRADRS